MAQAPTAPPGGGGAPRDNKTVKQFSGMNTQNERAAIPEGSFHWLENIQPIGPGNLHSIPGRSSEVVEIPPFIPPPHVGCPEDTVPTGPQSLSAVHCYQFNTGIPPGTLADNSSSQLNFVTGMPVGSPTAESFIVSVGTQSGFSVPYPDPTSLQILEAAGYTLAAITPMAVPSAPAARFFGQTAQAGISGHSDERSILFFLNGITPNPLTGSGALDAWTYFSYDTNTIQYLQYGEFGTSCLTWAKRGTDFWSMSNGFHFGTVAAFLRWDMTTGGPPVASNFAVGSITDVTFVLSLQATDNFLYALYCPNGVTTTIYRLDKATMAEVDHWDITGTFAKAKGMFVVSDDLIYVFASTIFGLGGDWNFGYFVPSDSPPVVHQTGSTVSASCINTGVISGVTSFHFNKGFFYLGYGGFGTGFTNVVKVGPLNCPDESPPIPIGT